MSLFIDNRHTVVEVFFVLVEHSQFMFTLSSRFLMIFRCYKLTFVHSSCRPLYIMCCLKFFYVILCLSFFVIFITQLPINLDLSVLLLFLKRFVNHLIFRRFSCCSTFNTECMLYVITIVLTSFLCICTYLISIVNSCNTHTSNCYGCK